MERWDDLQALRPVLTRRIISVTHNPVVVFASASDRRHLESVTTIA